MDETNSLPDAMLNMSEEKIVAKMMDMHGAKKNSGRLEEEMKKKKEREMEALRKIHEEQHKAKGEPLTETVEGGVHRQAAPTPPAPNTIGAAYDSKKEHEPSGLNWVATTEGNVMSLPTISDTHQFLAAASQQPGFAFGLVAKAGGTLCFIKYDEKGTVYMAEPSREPNKFANPGLNYDFDNDPASSKEAGPSSMVPNTRRILGRATLETKDNKWCGTPALMKQGKDFFEDVNGIMEDALDESREIDVASLNNPRQQALVTKLLNAAAELRGTPPPKDEKEELPLPAATMQPGILVEETNEEKEISLSDLSKFAIHISQIRKTNDSEQLEALEDSILNFLAENLLLNKPVVTKEVFESFINEFNNCLED